MFVLGRYGDRPSRVRVWGQATGPAQQEEIMAPWKISVLTLAVIGGILSLTLETRGLETRCVARGDTIQSCRLQLSGR